MKIAGIIAEFNPFHNGHALLLKKVHEAGFTHTAVVMSGNFTQRGEAACMLKSARINAALLCGADLVIELPLPFATASAERFAYSAVGLLSALNCVDSLCFGSECGDTDILEDCAEHVIALNGSNVLAQHIKSGCSFPKARALALGGTAEDILRDPNDTLAIEYIKAIKKTGSAIKPFAVKREGARHDGPAVTGSVNTASASFIRSLFNDGNFDEAYKYVPNEAAEIYTAEFAAKKAPFLIEKAEPLILSQLRRMGIDDFKNLPDVAEGLENRIWRAAQKACTLNELYTAIKSKRYTMSRIRRIVLSAFLGNDCTYNVPSTPYLRVVGFNERGIEILRAAKKLSILPICMRHADFTRLDEQSRRIYALECRATDLYSLCLPQVFPCGTEQVFDTLRIKC